MSFGHRQLVRAFVVACVVGLTARHAAASVVSLESSLPGPSAPFCGIHSLYTAFRIEGLNVEFSTLLKPRYVGSGSGSTLSELHLAALEQGAEAEVLTNLSVADLKHLSCPAILHVKSEFDTPEYNHFLLCVPTAAGQLVLYDPPAPPARTSGAELAASWDGTALLVSARPVALDSLRRWAALRVFLAATCAVAIIAPTAFVRRRSSTCVKRSALPTQCAVLLVVSSVVAASYHTAAPQGFAAQRAAVTAIRNAHFLEPPARVDLNQARLLLQQQASFIDARSTPDYNQGHVRGAINLPPNASRSDRLRILSGLPRGTRLVVYCQNPACPYASLMAKRLARDGFSDVSVFYGGWTEWYKAEVQLHECPEVAAGEGTL